MLAGLPAGAAPDRPAPLVVFIHGGPLSSWSGWSWRWNPWLLAARGYAVLLGDPALSTGYGQSFVERGRGRWGAEPYTDLMALVDATVARPDVDQQRTAAMGGSFGGYMANWVAGQTDRFRCIVTHASIWSLEQFHGTTDHAAWWEREFGSPEAMPERYRDHSPDRNLGRIRTPMLVIHGEHDHRVPIGEALRLWTDLTRSGVEAKFLYFPDENHWILTPPHVRVWYETVLAFLDQHVLGKDWARPELLYPEGAACSTRPEGPRPRRPAPALRAGRLADHRPGRRPAPEHPGVVPVGRRDVPALQPARRPEGRQPDRQPQVSLHLGDDGAGDDVVTFEGTATVEPDTPRADRVQEYLAKYQTAIEALGYEPGPFARTYSMAIRVRPTRVRAW